MVRFDAVRSAEEVPFLPAHRMHRRQNRHVRSHENVGTNMNRCTIHAGEVEIRVGIFADCCKNAVVELDRSLQIGVFSPLRDQLRHDGVPLFLLGLQGIVILLAQRMSFLAQSDELLIRRIVQLSGEHFLFFGHDDSPVIL